MERFVIDWKKDYGKLIDTAIRDPHHPLREITSYYDGNDKLRKQRFIDMVHNLNVADRISRLNKPSKKELKELTDRLRLFRDK